MRISDWSSDVCSSDLIDVVVDAVADAPELTAAATVIEAPDETAQGGDDDERDGTRGDDTLIGDAGDDHLKGDNGDDTLVGGGGDDHLDGDNGDDVLYGDEQAATDRKSVV